VGFLSYTVKIKYLFSSPIRQKLGARKYYVGESGTHGYIVGLFGEPGQVRNEASLNHLDSVLIDMRKVTN